MAYVKHSLIGASGLRTHTFKDGQIYMCVKLLLVMYLFANVFIYMCVYIYIYIYTCVNIYMYMYAYM